LKKLFGQNKDMTDTAIFIPARMGSTRLPNKPIAMIGERPMIIHVADVAKKANVGDVYIACPDEEIMELAKRHGHQAIKTSFDIETGTDRVYQAYKNCGKEYEYIVNLQGDIPLISPSSIEKAVEILKNSDDDISTLATVMKDDNERTNPNIVRAVIAQNGRALYFTRAAYVPYGDGDMYHHVGIYGYKNAALEKFVKLKQTPLELRERLEQLRALENGMTIGIAVVDDNAIGVDTPEDLELIRKLYSLKQ